MAPGPVTNTWAGSTGNCASSGSLLPILPPGKSLRTLSLSANFATVSSFSRVWLRTPAFQSPTVMQSSGTFSCHVPCALPSSVVVTFSDASPGCRGGSSSSGSHLSNKLLPLMRTLTHPVSGPLPSASLKCKRSSLSSSSSTCDPFSRRLAALGELRSSPSRTKMPPVSSPPTTTHTWAGIAGLEKVLGRGLGPSARHNA
mmetsp:Transcript_136447/g.423962  ORF Transcript_136447/g.423962 Transcript_136447/m.423962 type:complete len:200 (+) Transcript_136447:2570-3169(+)